jgi:hypothetical protein
VGSHDLFGLYCHCPDRHRRHSGYFGHDLQLVVFHVAGIARKDVSHGPRICPHPSHSQRTSTHAPRFPFHVRTVPSIQTSQQQSLPDLQSVYLDHLYCPWMMNNCVGAGNLKYFLFILDVYVGVRGVALFGWNYFLCADEDLYLSSLHFAFGSLNDATGCGSLSVYQQDADECLLWNHERYWNH